MKSTNGRTPKQDFAIMGSLFLQVMQTIHKYCSPIDVLKTETWWEGVLLWRSFSTLRAAGFCLSSRHLSAVKKIN